MLPLLQMALVLSALLLRSDQLCSLPNEPPGDPRALSDLDDVFNVIPLPSTLPRYTFSFYTSAFRLFNSERSILLVLVIILMTIENA